jgi:hypothetical protein
MRGFLINLGTHLGPGGTWPSASDNEVERLVVGHWLLPENRV